VLSQVPVPCGRRPVGERKKEKGNRQTRVRLVGAMGLNSNHKVHPATPGKAVWDKVTSGESRCSVDLMACLCNKPSPRLFYMEAATACSCAPTSASNQMCEVHELNACAQPYPYSTWLLGHLRAGGLGQYTGWRLCIGSHWGPQGKCRSQKADALGKYDPRHR